jgi:CubicO group peptidase (beta-lactamase class C family)
VDAQEHAMHRVALLAAIAALLLANAEPAAQVRVAFDVRHVTDVRAVGLADRAAMRVVTPDDPVRVASVSKLAVALGVMRLVESGKLDLDRDVSGYLGWSLRNPDFPEVPITLRMLLSHTSGLRDDADYAIPLGDTVRARLGDRRAWDVEHHPGNWFRYTNLNFPVVASVMEAATGERFDRLMAQLLFVPLKIDACYNWTTCSDAKLSRKVVLYDAGGPVRTDGFATRRPDCPVRLTTEGASCDLTTYVPGSNGALFSPQGGLRISARDLARIGQVFLHPPRGFLKPASLAEIAKPVWVFDGGNGDTEGGFYCSYGLAVQTLATPNVPDCRDNPFGDGVRRIGHAGEAYGLRSGLWLDMQRRTGVAFYATGIADDAPKGSSAFTAIEERLAKGD